MTKNTCSPTMSAFITGLFVCFCMLSACFSFESEVGRNGVIQFVDNMESFEEMPTHHHSPCRQCSCNAVSKTCDCCGGWSRKILLFFKIHVTARLAIKPLPEHYGVHIVYRLNDREEYNRNASMKYPPRICTKVPRYPHILTKSEVCLEFTEVDTCTRHFCAHIKGTIRIVAKTYDVYAKLGCAVLPDIPENVDSDPNMSPNNLGLGGWDLNDLDGKVSISSSEEIRVPANDVE